MIKLDSIDKKLIRQLESNPQQHMGEIANKLYISRSTVSRRIDRLLRNGVINYLLCTDPIKAGFQLQVLFLIAVNPSNLELTLNTLYNFTELKYLVHVTGTYNVFAVAWFRSNSEANVFYQKHLTNMEGVRKISVFDCVGIRKGPFCSVENIPILASHQETSRSE